MKRFLSLLLVLMMLLGGAAFAEAVDYVGYWVATSAEVAGKTIEPAKLGLNAYMELYEDGTCLIVMMGNNEDGTWAATETGIDVESDGTVVSFVLVDGALVLDMEGDKLIYTRDVYTLPLSGLTAADFEGEWTFTYVELGNEVYYADEIGTTMTLSIKEDKGVHVITRTDETGEVTDCFEGVCELEEIPDLGTVMYFLYTDEAGNLTGSGLGLLMFDNGELVWYAEDETGLSVSYCFVPAE